MPHSCTMGVSFTFVQLFQHFTENQTFTHLQRMAPLSDNHLLISALLSPYLTVKVEFFSSEAKIEVQFNWREYVSHLRFTQNGMPCHHIAVNTWSSFLTVRWKSSHVRAKLRCNSFEDICVPFEAHEAWHALPPRQDEDLTTPGPLSS